MVLGYQSGLGGRQDSARGSRCFSVDHTREEVLMESWKTSNNSKKL